LWVVLNSFTQATGVLLCLFAITEIVKKLIMVVINVSEF